MINYLGQIILNQSVRVRDFIYEVPWYQGGAPFRRSLLIIMMNTLKPHIITGGKFYAMGYDKFTAVKRLWTENYQYFGHF